jgi:hypothetical protein
MQEKRMSRIRAHAMIWNSVVDMRSLAVAVVSGTYRTAHDNHVARFPIVYDKTNAGPSRDHPCERLPSGRLSPDYGW